MLQTLDPLARLMGEWSSEIGIGSILIRIGLAFLFAAAVGCERSGKLHSAGLRTFILVSLASTSAMMMDCFVSARFDLKFPILSAAAVVGIAIISGYSILYSSKNQIKWLTTAAALWTCGIIGLLIGVGFYTAAIISFAAMFFCLSRLPAFEEYLKNRSNHFEIHLEMKDRRDLPNFIKTLRELGLRIDDIESNPAYMNSGLSVFSIALTITGKELKKYKTHAEIIEVLGTIEYISHVEELK